MEKRKLGKNRGVWSGKVVRPLEYSHEVKDRATNEVVETFYKLEIEAEIKNKKGDLIDLSVLPVTVPASQLADIRPEIADTAEKINIGDIVFVKGSWRAYDYRNPENSRTKLEQNAYVKIIEVHDDYPVRTRNKFEFEGVLVKKLYEFKRTEEGHPEKDEKGRLIPVSDEEGNLKYTVRKNKEGKIVNDFIVAINRPNGSDYIPCIAYSKLANFISKEVEVGAEVEGSGYIRTRRYTDRSQREHVAYEAVITYLAKKETEEAPETQEDVQENVTHEDVQENVQQEADGE